MRRVEDGVTVKQHRTRRTGARIMQMLRIVMMSFMLLQAANAARMAVAAAAEAAIDVKTINELQTYSDIKQGPESYKYYQMKLGPRYYTGT